MGSSQRSKKTDVYCCVTSVRTKPTLSTGVLKPWSYLQVQKFQRLYWLGLGYPINLEHTES